MKSTLITILITGQLFVFILLANNVAQAQVTSTQINTQQYWGAAYNLGSGFIRLQKGIILVQQGQFENTITVGSGNTKISNGKLEIQGAQTDINSAITSILGSIP